MTDTHALKLYGHPFSSYTWKAQIALYAAGVPFEFCILDPDHLDNIEVVQSAVPMGKFPVMADGAKLLFETTTIIEHLALHHAANAKLIPADADDAIAMRMIDRVFDNYVMEPMQAVVNEYLRDAENPDAARVSEARARLDRVYAWLESWLEIYLRPDHVSLIECAAAPSLFYADWVHPIGAQFPRLQQWRAHLLELPAVVRCVDDARPYRAYFPLGAPDRD